MSILTTIDSSADTLPPSLARIATAVRERPSLTVEMTITALAAHCGSSVASVVRFCHAIGLSGYGELRRTLAAELGRESAQFSAAGDYGSDIGADDSLREAVDKLAALERLAIEETIARLDDAVLERVVDAVDAADRLLLYGIGASRYVAADLGHKLLRIGRNAIVLSDPHEALASAAVPSARTAAIAFSHSGTTAETVRFIEAARETGAATIGVTSAPSSSLARLADHALFTHARESAFRAGAMVSRIAQLAIVDAIFIGAAQRRHDETIVALKRSRDATRPLHDA
ncbi:DNA-binding MurR/RpiR family transcriptional regulator [Microbacterium resistens]|uniref:DNA-binding MurR/RpiR family transcriptional regulator n=1 Tax=Microbacterium resistens TaxID=156977 RepID=A0ABU1S9D4_9MICO|nr:MurR/RpiR family transcriptional regulator [Microbacterium resistens]MDR6866231.1 DNA-binding MurR/RpiR family transcriptional regulator [Microbacterium resistens]